MDKFELPRSYCSAACAAGILPAICILLPLRREMRLSFQYPAVYLMCGSTQGRSFSCKGSITTSQTTEEHCVRVESRLSTKRMTTFIVRTFPFSCISRLTIHLQKSCNFVTGPRLGSGHVIVSAAEGGGRGHQIRFVLPTLVSSAFLQANHSACSFGDTKCLHHLP